MLKADFHMHTFYSKCSDIKPMDLIKTAVSKGYDIIGVVDHNNIKGGLQTKKIAGERITVIPGEEIKTNYGEVIVFLSDGKYNNDLIDICERAKEENHFIVAPHIFDFLRIRTCLRHNINKINDLVDAIETFNSRVLIKRFNDMANEYAIKNKIPKIAGSDSHFIEEIGNVEVYLDCKNDIEHIFNCIKKNKIRIEGRRCRIYSHFKTEFILPLEKIIKIK
jgi:hypothetical protein